MDKQGNTDWRLSHPILGELHIRENVRARRFVYRPREEGGLLVTVPPRWTKAELMRSIDSILPELQSLMKRYQRKLAKQAPRQKIGWNFCIETASFSLHFEQDPTIKDGTLRLRKEQGNVSLVASPSFDFEDEGMQERLTKVIEEQIRNYAKGILPARLRELSQQFNLPVKEIHVNAARGRWGSCVGKKRRSGGGLLGLLGASSTIEYTINLSLFTLLLPPHLQRLILLHELTHTLEMNHSARFHQKLDAMLGGTEKQLERELKKYKTDIFSFASSCRKPETLPQVWQ